VGVTVLPDLVTYPPAVPEVLHGALFGGAVSSDPGLAAILSFCDVCVRINWYTGVSVCWRCGSLTAVVYGLSWDRVLR